MKWFKKKKEENKGIDLTQYKIVINGRVMCAYEAMTGKPFLKIETEEDMKKLFYCSFVFNNPDFSTMKYEVFEILIQDPVVSNWIVDQYVRIGDFLSQFKADIVDEGAVIRDNKKEEEDPTFYMIEALSGLIVKMGIDPNYVMYQMEEWEITYYYRMMRDIDRERLTEQRLWTYLQILPHVGKKLQSPEKMLPFEWEKNTEKIKKEQENNMKAAAAFFKKQEEKNGEGRFDADAEQGGIREVDKDA